MKVTVTNISSAPVFLSSCYRQIAAGADLEIDRSLSDLDSDRQLKLLVNQGKVRVEVAAEAEDRGLGFSQGSGFRSVSAAPVRWVDATVGNDDNPGTQTKPFKTIQAALDSIPQKLDRRYIVYVRRGTYNENISVTHEATIFESGIRIIGTDWDLVDAGGVASASQAYFIDPPSGPLITFGGVNWTPNAFRGLFALNTTSGVYYDVASNTATTLELSATPPVTPGVTTFGIYRQAAHITSSSAFLSTVSIATSGYRFGAPGISSEETKLQRHTTVTLENLRISTTGVLPTGTGTVQIGGAGSVRLDACHIDGGPGAAALYMAGSGYMGITRSFFTGATGSVIRIFAASQVEFLLASTIYSTTASNGLHVGAVPRIFAGVGLIVDGPANGFVSDLSPKSIRLVTALFRNNQVGVTLWSHNNFTLDGGAIGPCTSHGLLCPRQRDTVGGGHNSITLDNFTILSCGGDAVRMESSHNMLMTNASGCRIANNTGWGVNLGATQQASYNIMSFETTTTMSANTAGDITLDGTTALTKAALDSDPDKLVTEANRFNRVVTI